MEREWLLSYLCNALWQIPFLWLAAALTATLVRSVGARAEHRVWVLALLGSAVVPACSLSTAFPGAGASGLRHAVATLHAARTASGIMLTGWATGAVCLMYLTYLLVAAVRFGSGLWRLHGVARRSEMLMLPGRLDMQWQAMKAVYGLPGIRLAGSGEVASPVAFAWKTPTVLLPVGLMERLGRNDLDEELRAALAHEGAHLARGDFLKHVGYTLVSLPVAMHPVTWLLRARVAESREMVCDALAAQTLGGAESYVGALLRLAAKLPGLSAARSIHAIGIFDANSLEKRVMRMIKQGKRLRGVPRVLVYMFAGLLGTAAFSSALALHINVGELASNGGGGKVYSVGGDVKAPKVTYSVDPEFPASAHKSRGGVCVLQLIVDAAGKLHDVHVVRSIRPDFDKQAVNAVKQYRFHPATRNGEAVATEISIEVNFQRF